MNGAEFAAMGGYGLYVWGSVAGCAALLMLEVLFTRHARLQALDAVVDSMSLQPAPAQPAQELDAPREVWSPHAAPQSPGACP